MKPFFRAPPRILAFAPAFLLALGLGLAMFSIQESRQGVLREAGIRAERQAMLVAERLQATLSSVDLMLEAAGETIVRRERPLGGRPVGASLRPELSGLYLSRRGETTLIHGAPASERLASFLPALAGEMKDARSRFDLRPLDDDPQPLLLVSRAFRDADGLPFLLTAALDARDVARELRRLDSADVVGSLILDHRGDVLLTVTISPDRAGEPLPAALLASAGLGAATLERTVAATYQLAYFPLKAVIAIDKAPLLSSWLQDAFRRTLVVVSAALFLLLALYHLWRGDLQLFEQRYRALLEDQTELVARCDASGAVVVCNAAFGRAVGLDQAALAGLPLADALCRAGGAAEVVETLEGLRADQSLACVAASLRLDGGERFIEWSCRAFFAGERLKGYQVVGHDVTDRVEREKLKEDVERITRHDIRSPMGVVLNAARLLRDSSPLCEEQRALLDHLESSARRAIRLSGLSLDLYRMETGQYVPAKSAFDLLPILAKLKTDLHPLARTKALSLDVVRADGGGGTFPALGDAGLVHTLLENLVRNALEASPRGGCVLISLRRPRGWVCIAIRNQGTVPREIRGRLFEKYATLGKAKGTGLGAYSARLMARAHGGDVTFETEEGMGTVFFVRLPDEFAERLPEEAREEPQAPPPAGAREAAPLRG